MKTFKPFVLLLALVTLLGSVPRAEARPSVSFDFFYDNLEPYGEWVEVGDYGYCWHPTGVDEDWAPYTDGYWAYTDGGWTWVSYEDFGGITYHYGRWARVEDEGWVWVPDYEWAPAWVSWRSSDDYVGWAPLPPRARFRAEIGFSTWTDTEFDIGPGYYNFCEYRHFGDPALRAVIIDRSRNVTIINRTTNITNITVNKTTNNIFVGGPQFQTVSARVARPIQVLKLKRQTDVAAIRAAGGKTLARQQGNQLVVLAPEVAKGDGKFKPAKVAKTITAPKLDHGWKGVKDPQEKQQIESKFKADAKGLTSENAPAKAVTAEDLKVVEEKTKGGGKEAATGLPGSTPFGKGAHKKGAQPAVTNELIAQPGASPESSPDVLKGAKGKKGKGLPAATPRALTEQPESVTPQATPFVKGKHKGEKIPADLNAQPSPSAPRKIKKETGDLQPFMGSSDQTNAPAQVQKKTKREFTPNQTDAPVFVPKREKPDNSAAEAIAREHKLQQLQQQQQIQRAPVIREPKHQAPVNVIQAPQNVPGEIQEKKDVKKKGKHDDERKD